MAAPDRLRIPYDAHKYGRFEAVGRLPDGTQFMAFVTGAFPTGQEYYLGADWQTKKRWLAIIHRFDAAGNHIGSESRPGAFEVEGREVAGEKAVAHLTPLLADLMKAGEPELCDVWVKPFAVELDGVTHGLFYKHYVEEYEGYREEHEYVMLQPQDIMFHPPWDSGEYST